MEQSKMTRRQRLTLSVMTLALMAVLAAIVMIARDGALVSPLPTAFLPISESAIPTGTVVDPGPETVVHESPTPSPVQVADTVLLARRIEALGRDVGEIRELPKQQEIALNFLDAQEMVSFFRAIVLDSERRAFVERQQYLLAALDLSPDPGEAYPPTVHSRAKHVIAFYDPAEAQIFVGPAGREGESPDPSLVHQYAHAMVDQHFDLAALKSEASNGDELRARDALMEGDAMATLALHSFGGVDGADLDELAEHMSVVEPTDYEGYLTVRAMRDVFLFPYREGTRFVATLLQTGWWPAVNTVYLDPPVSTEQILHPEKYVDTPRDVPRTVRLMDLSEDLGEGWQMVAQDVMGELILRAHLDQYLPSTSEAHEAAAGWDGDLAAVWRNGEGQEVLVMRTLWDDGDEAIEFVQSYNMVVGRRLRRASRVVRSILPSPGRWWRGEGGSAFLQREEDTVLIIWASDVDTMERVLTGFVLGEE